MTMGTEYLGQDEAGFSLATNIPAGGILTVALGAGVGVGRC